MDLRYKNITDYTDDWTAFSEDVLGGDERIWDGQEQIRGAVQDYPRTAVRSGHKIGKTWIAARIALCFLYTRKDSIVVTTAPTDRQVRYLLWAEINRQHKYAKMKLGGRVLTTEIQIAEKWFALGFTTKDYDPDKFQGFHSEGGVLVIVDEASGVSEDIFEAIEALDPDKILYIGNPISSVGTFYDAFADPAFHQIHISCYDSPNVVNNNGNGKAVPYPHLIQKEWIEDKVKRWGRESNRFKSRVLGEFPMSSEDTFISVDKVDKSFENWRRWDAMQRRRKPNTEEVTYGLDIARYGSDSTSCKKRTHYKIEGIDVVNKVFKYQGKNTTRTTNEAIRLLRINKNAILCLDDAGVGGGVTDNLMEVRDVNSRVVPIIGGGKVGLQDPDDFEDVNTELWWRMTKGLEEETLYLEPDPELKEQLIRRKIEYLRNGRMRLQSKKPKKGERKMPSPDDGDAVANSLYEPIRVKRKGKVFVAGDKKEVDEDNKRTFEVRTSGTLKRKGRVYA